MLYRNLLAMESEELLRSHPIDGAVLMGGCDKTTPGLIMGAITMDLPAIYVPAGPMLRGNWHGSHWAPAPTSGSTGMSGARERSAKDWSEIEDGIARSLGTCMTMGTAATMGDRRSARADAARRLVDSGADANHPRMTRQQGVASSTWSGTISRRQKSCRPRHSTTPSGCTWRSAAPPTPSSTLSPCAACGRRARHAPSTKFRGRCRCSPNSPIRQISDGRFFLCRRLRA